MKKSKKYIGIILSIILVLSIVGCGSSSAVYEAHNDSYTLVDNLPGILFDIPSQLLGASTAISQIQNENDYTGGYYIFKNGEDAYILFNIDELVVSVKIGTHFNFEEKAKKSKSLSEEDYCDGVNGIWMTPDKDKTVSFAADDKAQKVISIVNAEISITPQTYGNFAGRFANIKDSNGIEYSMFVGFPGENYEDLAGAYKNICDHITKSFTLGESPKQNNNSGFVISEGTSELDDFEINVEPVDAGQMVSDNSVVSSDSITSTGLLQKKDDFHVDDPDIVGNNGATLVSKDTGATVGGGYDITPVIDENINANNINENASDPEVNIIEIDETGDDPQAISEDKNNKNGKEAKEQKLDNENKKDENNEKDEKDEKNKNDKMNEMNDKKDDAQADEDKSDNKNTSDNASDANNNSSGNKKEKNDISDVKDVKDTKDTQNEKNEKDNKEEKNTKDKTEKENTNNLPIGVSAAAESNEFSIKTDSLPNNMSDSFHPLTLGKIGRVTSLRSNGSALTEQTIKVSGLYVGESAEKIIKAYHESGASLMEYSDPPAGCTWHLIVYSLEKSPSFSYVNIKLKGVDGEGLVYNGIKYSSRTHDIFSMMTSSAEGYSNIFCYYAVPNGCTEYVLQCGDDNIDELSPAYYYITGYR